MGLEHMDKYTLDIVFGPGSVGDTPEERAKTSKYQFVRSQDHLSLYEEKLKQTGRVISAERALVLFGFNKLYECIDSCIAVITKPEEPAKSFTAARHQLGLSVSQLAAWIGVSKDDINNIENTKIRNSIHLLDKVALWLGLDKDTWKPMDKNDDP